MTRAAAALVAALALASAGYGAAKVWPHLSDERAANAGLGRAKAARAIWRESSLPPALFDFWRSRLAPRERYYVQARPAGELAGDRPLIVRSYAAYWLLPAIQVRDPELADAIVSYRADPRALGLPLERVERWAGPVRASIARVRR